MKILFTWKKQTWSLHSIYMELISQKTPRLLQDWSIGRAIAWLAKFGIFVLVPGLHQIACKRWILGGLLMAMYFVAEFALENRPLDFYTRTLIAAPDHSDYDFSNFDYRDFETIILVGFRNLDYNLALVPKYFSWILLFLDVRKIEKRRLELNWFLVFFCLIGAWFWPDRTSFSSNLFVAQTNIGCPEICRNDIVAWHYLGPEIEQAKPGQLVIRDDLFQGPIVARVLQGSPQQLCDGELPANWIRPGEQDGCSTHSPLDKQYRIEIGPEPIRHYGVSRPIYWTGPMSRTRTSFSKIGSTHKYFVFNNIVTDAVGHTLFQIYNWTYFDPLNFIEKP